PVGQCRIDEDPRTVIVGQAVDAGQDRNQADDRTGGPRLRDVRPEVLDGEAAVLTWQATEELRHAVRLEALGGIERGAGDLRGFGTVPVTRHAAGDRGVVVGPDRGRVVAERVVGRV